MNIDETKSSMKTDFKRLQSLVFMDDFGKLMKMRETCVISRRIIDESL